ncbi:Glycine--tRNA ligase beta subunit [Desulfamplus magnetovallimortis]|uniref:Glycine--tRNA ligase beta subunit n=1 Tax=Desulfamplus magnetovallimortis TaxID=1246637 RepID=L0R4Y8_9BACT|nr:glycine--tRNA ligase subunit beta [Desulfamplus magnetovallimortis]CCO06617.1 Glycine--tRNA ligase beta subunit [Desulfamplus magnetovallimortis BW-1]SLM32668.1 Glycine--tRNA ligase beta subunit [Desulfamplus magnetovallimortis]
MSDLLIEIGAEEIPAGYIVPALDAFRESVLKALEKNRIEYGDAKCFGTPRRLALMVKDVGEMQQAETVTITGPPASAGFDKNGNPTIAAEKFAEKAGVKVDEIKIVDTPKGQYLSAIKTEKCEVSATIIEAMLPELILGIPFPKSMRWGDFSISFARPIISLMALLGETVLDFRLEDIRSSNETFGHPFMHPGRFKVANPSEYTKVLRDAGVIVDMDERKQLMREKIESVAKENNSKVLADENLIDIVCNLVEYPFPVLGKFDDEFLEVPDEVLITAMREHQKYFSLVDDKGSLKPCFIAVNNTRTRDMNIVAKGHEKVLRARLSDAKFFYKVDLESTMDKFAEKLKKVTFHAQLGSMFEKRERLVQLVSLLAELPENAEISALKADLIRAAELCKADLVSQMVIEFTNLQGIIGRRYAEKGGETAEVARAIEEHYRPTHSGGQLPETLTGRLLAIADKIDTICGCFAIDLVPTGASDPYALRRQSIGILQIMLDSGFTFSLKVLVEKSVALYFSDKKTIYVADKKKQAQIVENIIGFIKTRMTNMLVEQGYTREAVASAISVSCDNLPDTLLRVKALDLLRKAPDFEPLSAAFKRVVNILKKADLEELPEVNDGLFENGAEKKLYSACTGVASRVNELTKNGNYDAALKEIAAIRPDVDHFFDDVMVMVDDKAVRKNRIALLSAVAAIFENIADFSQI